MNEFRIFETAEFDRSLKRLDLQISARIRRILQERVYPQLRKQPFVGTNIKKLRDYTPNTWRFRIGDYRVFYTIDDIDHVVLVVAVENRKDAYK